MQSRLQTSLAIRAPQVSEPFRIAIASGKGGTGKTTIAVNLAVALSEAGETVAYVDCDVEEPNGHIFLKPNIRCSTEVELLVPEVNLQRCTFCGACAKVCRFSAIAVLPKDVLTFPKLCHSCGGCVSACPEGAIREVSRTTGVVERGHSGHLGFLQGRLNIGEAMAPPVIRALLKASPADGILILDAPPGTSCPVIETVEAADIVLLVTEPTPFGLNDLKLAVSMVQTLGLPFGVVVNRAGTGDRSVADYCSAEQIPILFQLPNALEIAQAYSRGELALEAIPELRGQFLDLHAKLRELAEVLPKRPKRRTQVVPELVAASTAPSLAPSDSLRLGRKCELRELVVISGKGGTGKTSIVASLSVLEDQALVADCDVDAADLHLILARSELLRLPFTGASVAVVNADACTGCGLCVPRCRFDAIQFSSQQDSGACEINTIACEGCGVCVDSCPEHAVSLMEVINGHWFISSTKHSALVHARLGIAQENSGKLVSLVRKEANALSRSQRRGLLICDGSPGIGCPVIASITGASYVLIVTEPTLSGLHDLKRAAELCEQFKVRVGICINKADINPELSAQIGDAALARGIPVLGQIRYDESVTAAQVNGLAVVEYGDGPAAADIRALWSRIRIMLA